MREAAASSTFRTLLHSPHFTSQIPCHSIVLFKASSLETCQVIHVYLYFVDDEHRTDGPLEYAASDPASVSSPSSEQRRLFNAHAPPASRRLLPLPLQNSFGSLLEVAGDQVWAQVHVFYWVELLIGDPEGLESGCAAGESNQQSSGHRYSHSSDSGQIFGTCTISTVLTQLSWPRPYPTYEKPRTTSSSSYRCSRPTLP